VTDVPGIDQTAQSEVPGEKPNEAEVRFAGERVIYKTREERIAESAYQYAASRGFASGYELEDWLKAEKEVDALLSGTGFPAD
jgi:hypothetical protein